MATPRSSSAPERRALPSALELDELDLQDLRHVAAANSVPVEPRASKDGVLRALRSRFADGAFWDAALAELPDLCLLVLEALCELGGGLSDEVLLDLVAARAGVPRPSVQSALDRLRERNLAVRLTTRDHRRESTLLCLFA